MRFRNDDTVRPARAQAGRLVPIGDILWRVLGRMVCGYCRAPLVRARTIIPSPQERLSIVFCQCGMPHDVPAVLPSRIDTEPEPVAACDRVA